MNARQNDVELATKEDIKNLEITILAGFEACAYLLNCIMLAQTDTHGELNCELAKTASDNVHKQFRDMLEVIRNRILND